MKKLMILSCLIIILTILVSDSISSKKPSFRDRLEDCENRIEKLENRISKLEQKNQIKSDIQYQGEIAECFTKPLELGKVAYAGKENLIYIEQVIDSSNMIAKLVFYKIPIYAKRNPESRLLTMPPPIIRYDSVDTIVWIKGYNTEGLVDGKRFKPLYPFKVTNTKTYETAIGGSNTVFVLEPVSKP